MPHRTRRLSPAPQRQSRAGGGAPYPAVLALAAVVCAVALAAHPASAAGLPPTIVPPGAPGALSGALFGGTTPSLPNPGSLFTTLAASAATIEAYVAGYATTVFVGLVAIDVAWTLIQALLGRGEVGELVVTIVQKVVTFNIVYWVFVVNGYGIVTTIVSSLYTLGNNILPSIQGPIPAPTDPLGIIGLGIGVASPMLVEATVLGAVPDEVLGNGATNLMTGLIDINLVGAVLTVGAYAFLAGTLALAIVEAYIVTSAGIFVTGFMGSRWTVSIGEKYFSYAFSVGVKLLMVYVCVGLLNPLAGIIAGFSLIPVVGPIFAAFIALVAAMIAFSAPQFAAALITGSSNSSFGSFAGTALGAVSAASGLGSILTSAAGKARNAIAGGAQGAGGGANALPSPGDGDANRGPSLGANDPVAHDTTGPAASQGDVFDGALSTKSSKDGFTDPLGERSALSNATWSDLGADQPAHLEQASSDATVRGIEANGDAQRSLSNGDVARTPLEPATVEPGRYAAMSGSDLRQNVNAKTVGQMSREQLLEVRRHGAYDGLRGDQRDLVQNALHERRTQSADALFGTIGKSAESFAKALPAHDRGETGAVSIRVNV